MQLYMPDLDIKKTVKSEYSMSITHKPSGVTVKGKGDHEYQLRCKLLNELQEKVRSKQESESNQPA